MTPHERGMLVDRLWRRMLQAQSVVIGRIEKLSGLHKTRLTKAEQDCQAVIWREAARELLEIVEEAGYALPPKNDLRTQLTKAARELKAHTWSRGYSYEGEDVDARIAEARAEAISDVGRVLLDALTEQ